MPSSPIDAVLVGAGQRGHFVFGAHALANPDALRFVAVVDPDPTRRARFGEVHGIPPARRFEDHRLAAGLDAAAWIVTSPDRHHVEPCLTAFEAGADVLVEKPVAATLDNTLRLLRAAENSGRRLHVALVLRYTPFFGALREVVRSGRLGDIVTVEHRENVVAWHMAHSFVRGNWANAAESTPMIVQKCCHDFDILEWTLDSPVRSLHSYGSLHHFRPEHAPAGAPERCTDGCPAASSCPFDATRIYLNEAWTGWPVHVITDDLSPGGRLEALRTGPYGRCVYTAGSDVADHQVVSMERADGSTTVLVMHGHSGEESRTMRYDGTRATLRGRFGRNAEILIQDHNTNEIERIEIAAAAGGHGGGDRGVIGAFLDSVRHGTPSLTEASDVIEGHLLAFTAERSRTEGTPIDVAAERGRLGLGQP